MRHFAAGCEIERAQRFAFASHGPHQQRALAPRQFSRDGRIKFYIAFASNERDRETQFLNEARAQRGALNGIKPLVVALSLLSMIQFTPTPIPRFVHSQKIHSTLGETLQHFMVLCVM